MLPHFRSLVKYHKDHGFESGVPKLAYELKMTYHKQINFSKMKAKSKSNIYMQAQRFADVTRMLIAKGNIIRAKKCLQIAEDIFVNGTSEVKNVISNIYLYSVSSFMEIHHCNVKGLLPTNLKIENYKQVNASGL